MDDIHIPEEELKRIREDAEERHRQDQERRRDGEASVVDHKEAAPAPRRTATASGPGRRWADYVTPTEYPPGVRRGSYLLSLFAVALVLLVHTLLFGDEQAGRASDRLRQYETTEFWLRCAGLGAAGAAAVILFTYSLRLRAPGALAVMRADRRPPVLLLRAFQDDYAEVENAIPRLDWRRVWSRFGAERTRSFEEVVEGLFGRCGPVVAIGRPGEAVPPLGAARFWIGDDHWQTAIEQLLGTSQRVVMLMGRPQGREGLTWEVRQIFGSSRPEKVVLLMPPVDEGEARERWQAYRELSGDRLPEYQGGELAVGFDPDGTCRVVRATKRWGVYSRDEATYRAAIRVPPPSRGGRMIVAGVLAIMGVLAVAKVVLPAVQMTREAKARVTCANNLKQLGMAQHHHNADLDRVLANPALFPYMERPGNLTGRTPPTASPVEAFGLRVGEVGEYEVRRFDLPPRTGLTVYAVVPNSPAEKVGLRPGLVITAVQGEPISNTPEAFDRQLASVLVGNPSEISFEAHDIEAARRADGWVRRGQYALWTFGSVCLCAAAVMQLRGSRGRTSGYLDYR